MSKVIQCTAILSGLKRGANVLNIDTLTYYIRKPTAGECGSAGVKSPPRLGRLFYLEGPMDVHFAQLFGDPAGNTEYSFSPGSARCSSITIVTFEKLQKDKVLMLNMDITPTRIVFGGSDKPFPNWRNTLEPIEMDLK